MNQGVYHRQKDLYGRLNSCLGELTGIKKDFLVGLTNDKIVALKYALSDVNNVVTLLTSLSFIDHISCLLSLRNDEKIEMEQKLNSTKPNTNGFDISFSNGEVSFFAEIKSTVPMNRGDRFGIAQINAILDDALKLYHGTHKVSTEGAYKFIGILDIGDSTSSALTAVFRKRNLKINTTQREKRNKIKENLILWDSSMQPQDLVTDMVYIIRIKI